jgi:Tfp pilus assembly protein PilN
VSQQINLFNPIFLKQKKYFSAVTMVQALGLVLLGSLLLVFYASFQLSSLTDEAKATAAQLRTAQGQLAKVTTEYGPRQKSASLAAELKQTEANVVSLQRVFDTLQKGEFGNTRGYADYLRAFSRQINDGIWLTGLSIHGAGIDIELKGRALQPEMVPAYITRLKRETVMQGKSFAALEMRDAESRSADKNGQRSGPGYIEFSLRSSAAGGNERDQSGVKGQ